MNGSGKMAVRFAQALILEHAFPGLHNGARRAANILMQRNDELLGQGGDGYRGGGAVCLVSRWFDAPVKFKEFF